ncbi:MAG: hypothetical protein IMZ50_03320, partial [Candidatus Atribacteria bacterium]|nr:hypothetical protein [Candidatus Atribacteria bacterium]
ATATIAADVLKFERSGMGLHPGDVLNFVLTSDAHGTDDLYIYGAEMIYRSNLAFSDESDR